MPRNNSAARKGRRKADAEHRAATYDMEHGPVAQREADRGYPTRLNAQKAAETAKN